MSGSLGFHGDGISFQVVFSQDASWCSQDAATFLAGGCQQGFWEVVGRVLSPFDLSRTLLVGGGLLVPCALPGPPVLKQLIRMVSMVPGQGGQFPFC